MSTNDERGGPPESVGAVVQKFLRAHGHASRVAQASAIDRWRIVAGPQIARVTEALSIGADGTLVVAVATNAWMSELSMHEREFVVRLNAGETPGNVRRIRWQLRPVGGPV